MADGFAVTAAVLHWRRAFAAMEGIVERRNSIPLLDHLLLVVEGNSSQPRITLSGTDLDIVARADLSGVASVEGGGSAAVGIGYIPFHIVNRLLQAIDADRLVEIKVEDNGIRIAGPDGTYNVASLSPEKGEEQFNLKVLPGAATVVEAAVADADADTKFREALRKCVTMVSTEETRYYLNGAFLHTSADGPRAVATDGHRMTFWPTGLPLPSGIIPRKALPLIANRPDLRRVLADAVRMRFEWDDLTLETKLIDGTYPDYQRVIPTEKTIVARAVIDQPALRRAVERLRPFISSTLGLFVIVEPDRLTVGALDRVVSTVPSVEELPASVTYLTGEPRPLVAWYNAAYFLSAVAIYNGVPHVTLHVDAEGSGPAGFGIPGEPLNTILMPMRAGDTPAEIIAAVKRVL